MSDEIEPHIYKRFEILQKLGKGAYGIVWKAVDRKTKKMVALKKVFDAFHNDTDAQRTFREVMILYDLDNHENVVKLYNVIRAENNRDIYLVFEYMETDLHAVIRAGILKEDHKTYIMYQTLKALKYVQSAEIVHRDLKPSNLLVNSECLVKMADFGLARSIINYDDNTPPVMTEYVATRWYRAPEIVLGSSRYSKAVDMWSIGCILGELIRSKPIFPGKSTINQLELIVELLGSPTKDDIKSIGAQTDYMILNSLNSQKMYNFKKYFKGASPDCLDFLRRCLEFNPDKRITVEESLEHPYLSKFRNPIEETVSDKIVNVPISDSRRLSLQEYRSALYDDILQKKKERRKKWQQKYLKQLGVSHPDSLNDEDLIKLAKERKKRSKNLQPPQEQTQHPENVEKSKTNNSKTKSGSSVLYDYSYYKNKYSGKGGKGASRIKRDF